MYEDILLPTDGSESMDAVIDHAADIAARRDATVHALYVIDDRSFLTLQEEMKGDVVDGLRAEGETATTAVASRLEADGVTVRTAIRKGNPADEVLDYVEEVGIDLVVMGTHGADYERNMLGSVSQKVVTMSDVPVLTVNIGER
ncbi:universal stress protein [Haloplanus aerogenes]|uniref:Nucleotide-binding universal stress UspA family protein n=1 Tax=Haloplanus aerogenes TaxID=660522 RepID=A0A3M0CTQ1_9EURY|nr:universal stress protein [Haloplanus aerogenes]AZH26612.1 universal stress protein [Haloplanus aerogenes]RMB12844.1 nucleotide-binding universal stress UspA family protein [Haloplanus aerogenes]